MDLIVVCASMVKRLSEAPAPRLTLKIMTLGCRRTQRPGRLNPWARFVSKRAEQAWMIIKHLFNSAKECTFRFLLFPFRMEAPLAYCYLVWAVALALDPYETVETPFPLLILLERWRFSVLVHH